MNEYSIYWIREEFVFHFFHKNHILYQFIMSYEENKNNPSLTKQFHYITKAFSKQNVISSIKTRHKLDKNVYVRGNNVEILQDSQVISLHIYEKHLRFRCTTLYEADQLLFSALRLLNPYLFVLGDSLVNTGWISPIQHDEQYNKERSLYSII